MTRYKLPEVLGSGEIEAEESFTDCPEHRPEYDLGNGLTLIAPAGQPLETVKPPLPPEPPENTVVRAGARVMERHDDDMAPLCWYGTGSSMPISWADVCAFGAPVLLVPAPEPVELPWASAGANPIHRYNASTVTVLLTGTLNGQPQQVSGAWPVATAVEVARALWAAAEAQP